MFEPNAIVFYVDKMAISSNFYQNLLGIKPDEPTPTFNSFTLSNGMSLGLKAKHTVEPPADKDNGSGELAFTLDNKMQVDDLFAEWQKKGIDIAQPPTVVCFGYTFLALDPDGNRLRVLTRETS